MIISQKEIESACKTTKGKNRVYLFYPFMEKYLPIFGITGRDCERMFLAQVMHESAEFRYTRELGGHKYLDKYDTGKLAIALGNSPEDDDDGQKYCGRGLIQLTGLANYKRFKAHTGIDVVTNPEYLETPEGAVHSACWFWGSRNLNSISTDIRAVTKRINGGYNGLEDRIYYFSKLGPN